MKTIRLFFMMIGVLCIFSCHGETPDAVGEEQISEVRLSQYKYSGQSMALTALSLGVGAFLGTACGTAAAFWFISANSSNSQQRAT